ncbi:MAG: HAMP domain-containing sensor histidine kinase [Candidatus Omnitrophota bacterium]
MKKLNNNEYKVIISELGFDPFRILNSVFVLIGVIPLLVLFYFIMRDNLLHKFFLGNNGFVISIAIAISLLGYLYAYILVKNLLIKLLKYAQERKLADKEKTEVMLAVTHDLKNPLMTIKISMDNLREGVGGELNSSHASIVKICLFNVERLFKFIGEILDSSKNDFIRMFINRELIDFSNIIKNEVDNFMQQTKNTNLDLRYRPSASNSNLWGDKNKLSRVVMNLISNAIKYTPTGGMVDVLLSSDVNTITLSVINTGPGITSDEMEKLFKKFGRLDKHSEIEGTGLGLSIVKDIIDLHNGHITVKSEPGKNTEFKVVLPSDLRGKMR